MALDFSQYGEAVEEPQDFSSGGSLDFSSFGEPVEEETPSTTFIGGMKDLARIIASPITTGLQAIGTAIGGGLAGQNILEAAQEGAEKREFLGADLNTETGAGQAVEKFLGQAFEKIHQLGGDGAVDLFQNDAKRAFIKAIPAIGILGNLYEQMNPDSKAKFEGIVGAGGTVAPDILLTLLGGKAGKPKETIKKSTMDEFEAARREMEAAKEQPVFTQQPADLFPETLETPYGTRTGESPSGWSVDENGIPVNRAATGELQRAEMSPTEVGMEAGLGQVAPLGVFEKTKPEGTFVPKQDFTLEERPIGREPQMDLPFEKVTPEQLRTAQESFDWTPTETIDFSKYATPEQGIEHIQRIPTDITQRKGEIPYQESLGLNASGESAASLEAINRLRSQEASGIKQYMYNPEKGTSTPLVTADRVDTIPAKGEAKVQIDAEGKITVLENNSRFGNVPLANRAKAELPVGQTGFGKGQRGSIGFKKEPPTLVEEIQSIPKEEWIAKFNKRYPGQEGIAEQLHSRFYKEPSKLSAGSLDQVVKGLDYALAPISTRLGNIHAELKQGLVDMEAGFTKRMGKDIQTIDPLFTGVNKLGKQHLDAINSSLLNNDFSTLRTIVPKELRGEIGKLQTTLKEVGMDLQKYGVVKELRTDYFPRMVKDLEGLYGKLGIDKASQLQDIIRKREGKAGPLSDIEVSDITNRYLQGNYAKGGKPGFARGRQLDGVPPELQKYYYKPTETIHTYLRSAAFQIERAKFFGKDKVIDPQTGRIDVSQSIGAKVQKLRNEGKIKPEQVEEVASVLNTRFGAGQSSTNAIMQGVKDLVHVVTMGDVGNALMQAADAALLPFSEGIRPTIMGVVNSLSKDKLSPKDFGILNHLSEEFISDRATTKLANVVLAPLGAVDRAAKTLILNAVEQSGRAVAKKGTKGHYLFNEYKDRFGAEFPQLIDDLKTGKRTELTDRFVISELSNRQPIFKSEYTQLYLDSPNMARPAMALTSFMIKTGDFMRNRAYNQIKTPGKRIQGIKNLAAISTALVLGQVSMDAIRDYIANKPIEDPREASKIAGALFGVFRFNEYFSDDIKKGAFGEAAAGLVAPPYKAFDPLTKDLVALAFGEEDIYGEKKGFTGKSIKAIPFIGDELYGWSEFGQKERAKLEREQEREKLRELMK